MNRRYLIALVAVVVLGTLMISAWAEGTRCPRADAAAGCHAAQTSGAAPMCGKAADASAPRCGMAAAGAAPGCAMAAAGKGCPMAAKPHGDNAACADCGKQACADCDGSCHAEGTHPGECGSCPHRAATGKPGMGMHRGAERPGIEATRAISGGSVKLNHHTQRRAEGSLILNLSILDEAGKPIESAVASGFVYPVGDVAAGRGAAFNPTCNGSLNAWLKPPAAEALELAVRVKRAGMADDVLYFGLASEPRPQRGAPGCPAAQ